MTEKKLSRSRVEEETGSPPDAPGSSDSREYNYVLQLTEADRRILDSHRVLLTEDLADFAEIFYDYLFDNPGIADVLYTFERNGGDAGRLVRKQLNHLVGCISGCTDQQRAVDLVETGTSLMGLDIRPVWVVGAYRLFLDYLCDRTGRLSLSSADRMQLESALLKLLFRDLGMTMEEFWRLSLRNLKEEVTHFHEEQDKAESLLSGVPHLMWNVDVASSSVVYANLPVRSVYGETPTAPFPCLADTLEDDRQTLLDAWQGAVNGNRNHVEVRMRIAGGEKHWYRVSLYPEHDRQNRTTLVNCILEDVDRLVSERRRLERLSTTDSLTRLPNRALWTDNLARALAGSRRAPGSHVVVISLDINHFRMYNDTLGRQTGDVILCEVASRLNAVVRESDSLARLGGDQFGILLQPVSDTRLATERLISEVSDAFDMPLLLGDRQMSIGVTLGIARFPGDGTNEESLLSNAESAMHRAKRNGLPYQFYDPVNDISPVEKMRYSGQIRSALDNNEFELHYQPQVEIGSSSITGAEALLRWEHPSEGVVMPHRIIPVAEQLGMITHITDWVLVTALKQCKAWSFAHGQIPVSVNVSARSFQNPKLVEKIDWALEQAGVNGECLEIEITEATLMQDLDGATEVLEQLSERGITIAIDDFGTGYSSLTYLKKLPINTIKIDQSFIMDVAFDSQDVAIVRSVIELGHSLGCKVVAEGVESSMAWEMLESLGCDAAQGFHISRPLPDQPFADWISENRAS